MGHRLKQNKVVNSRTDFFYYMFRNVLLFGIPLLIVSAIILSNLSLHSSATISDSDADNITLRVSTSCTISSTVISEHSVDLNGGQYGTDIGNTKINTYCNDNNGYSIYAIGSSNNVDGNTDLVSSTNGSYSIHTNIYNIGDTTSSWAMKLTAGTGTGVDSTTGQSVNLTPPAIVNNYNNYNVIPENYTLVASRASGTNMTTDTTASGSYFNTTYAIYTSSVQPPDTYIGRVKYLMVHPQSNSATITFDDSFARAGKVKVYQEGNNSYYAMQDMTNDICYPVAFNTSTQLVDTRDNKLYWVTKLKDGHCWMTQNLDLSIGGANTQPLNSNNTDINTTASGSSIYTNGYSQNNSVWTWTPASTAITSDSIINYSNNTVSNWNQDTATPASAEGGDIYYVPNSVNSNIKYSSLSECITANHTEGDCKHYHVGNYYNWTAAVASNSSNSLSANYSQAANSICPKGWRLPMAANSSQTIYEFGDLLYDSGIIQTRTSVLYTDNGPNNIRKSPLWFVQSGNIDNGTLWRSDSNPSGVYWSSTVRSDSIAYLLYFSNTEVNPSRSDSVFLKRRGFSIRCLVR